MAYYDHSTIIKQFARRYALRLDEFHSTASQTYQDGYHRRVVILGASRQSQPSPSQGSRSLSHLNQLSSSVARRAANTLG